MRVAAIDCGTNSCLLLVLERRGDEVRVLEDRCRIEGLGRGVDRTGRLDPDAVARTLDALREYRQAMDRHGIDVVGAVGTQALREAENGEDFLGPAREILGVPVEVITGEREAELVFASVRFAFPDLRDVLVCDVGGGSTELIVGRGGAIASKVSVPIGSVRMKERFLTSDPPRPDEVQAMTAAIDDALSAGLRGAPVAPGMTVVGTAGTVTTLAAVELGLEPYDGSRVQGFRLDAAAIERQLARYLELGAAERRRIKGLEPRRADVIPAGAAIVARLLVLVGATSLVVSDQGVRWGLAHELASRRS